MQLRRLTLRNLRSYTDAVVDLGPGTTLIAGDVGSGKTSLLYAVEMALFGFAEVEDAAHLVRHRASDAEVSLTLAEDGRTFELRRKFLRRHRKGRETFDPVENSFRHDGARTQYSATELRQRAIELLGFPDNPNPRSHSDLWRWAVYVPQERMRDVLDQDADDRLETIRKALGLEQYRTAADNAQEVAAELRKRSEIRTAEADRLAHWIEEVGLQAEQVEAAQAALGHARRTEAELRAAAADLEGRRDEVARARRQIEADQREADALAAQRGDLQRARSERARLRDQRHAEAERVAAEARAAQELARAEPVWRAALAERRADSERRHAEVDALRSEAQELAVTQARSLALSERIREVEARSVVARRDVDQAEGELDRLAGDGPAREPVAPVAENVPALDRQLRSAQAEVERRRAALARAEQEASEVAALVEAGVCPRCHQAVTAEGFAPHAAEAARASDAARALLAAGEASRDQLEAARSSRERFERVHDRWLEVEKRRELARAGREASRARLQAVEREAAELGEERRSLLRRLDELGPVARTLESLTAELQPLDAELVPLQEQAEQAGQSAARADALEGQLASVRQELARIDHEDRQAAAREREIEARREEIAARLVRAPSVADADVRLGRELAALRPRLDAAVGEIARNEQLGQDALRRRTEAERGAEERSALGREAEHLRQLAAWFSGPFREASLRLERQMLGQAHREFERAFTRYFGTLIEDVSLVARLDAHFAPYAEVEGEWTPPAALSGGERTALALAYRLALGGVVRGAGRLKLATLILDEPTDGFSPEQVARMGELLEELGLPQVVLVSHEAGLSSVADRIVRVTKAGGVSSVSAETGVTGEPPGEPPARPTDRPRRRRTVRLDEPPTPR